MADNRITKQRVVNHWHYGWWKYVLWAIATWIGIDLLFSMTAYRPPEEKKIQLYMCNGYADTERLAADLWPALLEACPGQEELTGVNINLLQEDYYAQMQFTTYIAAQEGDVCLLPLKEVRTLAADGAEYAFVDLMPYVESGVIKAQDIDLEPGMLTREDGTRSLYAIPADTLYGLYEYGCDPQGGLLCAMVYGGNDDTAATLIGQMIERFKMERPSGGESAVQTQIFQ